MADCANGLVARQVLRINGTPTRALSIYCFSFQVHELPKTTYTSLNSLPSEEYFNREYPFFEEMHKLRHLIY